MPKYTDSAIIDHNDDGSWTVTTVETHFPATRAQKAAAWGTLGLIAIVPVVPLLVIAGYDAAQEKLQKRRERKLEK